MSQTFCPLPWMFQAVRNNGDFRICCQANVSPTRGLLRHADGRVANAATDDPEEVRNLALMKEARVLMLKGEWPASCVRCAREEGAGLRSRRIYENQLWGETVNADSARAWTAVDGTLDPEGSPLLSVDLRFGNKCNLKCRMCSPKDSDFWYDDHVALQGPRFHDTHGTVRLEPDEKGRWRATENGYDWYESGEKFWGKLREVLPGLRHLHIVGGEPLLLEKHYELIERIVRDDQAGHITLEYNTNLTLLPQKILELWSRFQKVRVGVSLDAEGALGEYIRSPSKWSVLERNLERLDVAPGPIDAWISTTVQIYNVFYLPELIDWRLRAGFRRINSGSRAPLITSHPLHNAAYLNLRALPAAAKDLVEHKFAAYHEAFVARAASGEFAGHPHAGVLEARLKELLQGYVQFMRAEDLSGLFGEFVKYTNALDKIRGQRFAQVAPEWAAALDASFL